MSKKNRPLQKFRVPVWHPAHDVAWVVWAVDAASAKVCAKWSFTAKHGYAPTYIGEPTVWARRPSPMFAALLGAALAWDADPYCRHHHAMGGHIFGD